jgi:hypothetical protein
VSLSVEQLIWRLQKAVKEDPKIAHAPVLLSQYDSESASQNGYEAAEGVEVDESSVTIN